MRLGKFLSPYFQTGLSANWSNFNEAPNEWGAGVFANFYVGRLRISSDFTGGKGGVRGFVHLGFNWGGAENIDRHPIDSHYDVPIDAVSWVTTATPRDYTIKLRSTFTGPSPPQVTPNVLTP
jgi:hypothetical protein